MKKSLTLEPVMARCGSMNDARYALHLPYVALQRWRLESSRKNGGERG